MVKIIGVHFTHNQNLFYKMNFETIEKSLRESLKGWSWRGLALLGRIQVIKSFAIPKILYRASLISTKKDFIKIINNLLYSFVWKGKDKAKCINKLLRERGVKNATHRVHGQSSKSTLYKEISRNLPSRVESFLRVLPQEGRR